MRFLDFSFFAFRAIKTAPYSGLKLFKPQKQRAMLEFHFMNFLKFSYTEWESSTFSSIINFDRRPFL
jgi:hypothetical protein